MQTLVSRVAEEVQLKAPDALCFACLADQQRVREHDVRSVALVLIARVGLHLTRQVCSSCHLDRDVIVARDPTKAA
jgi:hypothetical protein